MNYKKRCVWLFSLFVGLSASAQINITYNQLNLFNTKVIDLFNASIINSGAVVDVYCKGEIFTKSGKTIIIAKTDLVELPQGKLLSLKNLHSVYSYWDNSISQTGALPIGSYKMCVSVYAATDNELLVTECIDAEVISLSPPMLLSPENESEVDLPNPMLMWLPPTPITSSLSLFYDLKLVEIYQNQTPFDAITRNQAIFQKSGINNTNLLYPANAFPLKDNVKYAWRVAALSYEGTLIGETEVWWFIKRPLFDSSETDLLPVNNFVRLKSEKTQDYIVAKDEIKLVYAEKYESINAQLIITDFTGRKVYERQISFVQGENRFILNLSDINELKNKSYYNIEILAKDRPSYYLMFKNIK